MKANFYSPSNTPGRSSDSSANDAAIAAQLRIAAQKYSCTPTSRPSNRVAFNLKHLTQQFIQFLTPTNEPRITKSSDRSGNCFWRVYDPTSGYNTVFASEAEVRVWLEQRYS